ncbi:MAG: hypothetical protein FWE02_07080 [Defluviitaleaceae bacterium]|nr:hypothetical protein [Defluviitaleaceae bacterium]
MLRKISFIITICAIFLSACTHNYIADKNGVEHIDKTLNYSEDYDKFTLPSEQNIAEFIITNYTTSFLRYDVISNIYADYQRGKLTEIPNGINDLVAVGFNIYDINGDGELFLVITFGLPETGFLIHRFFRYINGEFTEIEVLRRHSFFRGNDGRIILVEGSDYEGRYKFSYLSIDNGSFNRDVFAVFGEEYDIMGYEELYIDLEESWELLNKIYETYEEIVSISTEGIYEIASLNPKVIRWIDYERLD